MSVGYLRREALAGREQIGAVSLRAEDAGSVWSATTRKKPTKANLRPRTTSSIKPTAGPSSSMP
jgi:hypothetical protein